MKRQPNFRAAYLLITLLVTLAGFSQSHAEFANFQIDALAKHKFIVPKGVEADKLALANLRAVNEKAFSRFNKMFKNPSDIYVSASTSETYISFLENGIRNRVRFNNKGKWLSTIRYYIGAQVPSDISRQVRMEYSGYKVFDAIEIRVGANKAHLVGIEKNDHWMRIKVVEGDMEVYEEHNKR